MFQESREAFTLKPRLHEKAAICGVTAWIFVAFDTLLLSGKRFHFLQSQLPQWPRLESARVVFSVTDIKNQILHKTHKKLASQKSNTKVHTRSTYRGGLCARKWEGFTSGVKTKQGRGLGLADCFLKCKGVNVQKFANVRKKSPHLNTTSLLPSPLSIPATGLPLNVFTLSSFDWSQTALFYFTGES